jgi:hypothetical protein
MLLSPWTGLAHRPSWCHPAVRYDTGSSSPAVPSPCHSEHDATGSPRSATEPSDGRITDEEHIPAPSCGHERARRPKPAAPLLRAAPPTLNRSATRSRATWTAPAERSWPDHASPTSTWTSRSCSARSAERALPFGAISPSPPTDTCAPVPATSTRRSRGSGWAEPGRLRPMGPPDPPPPRPAGGPPGPSRPPAPPYLHPRMPRPGWW